jgi:hypothetical protein
MSEINMQDLLHIVQRMSEKIKGLQSRIGSLEQKYEDDHTPSYEEYLDECGEKFTKKED